MLKDLRFAARMLLRSPGFTVAAILVLTLGIGATTTMFGATNAVLLRPLPFPDPDRLFVIRETRPQAGLERTVVSAEEYLTWTRGSRVVENAAILSAPGVAVAIDDGAWPQPCSLFLQTKEGEGEYNEWTTQTLFRRSTP